MSCCPLMCHNGALLVFIVFIWDVSFGWVWQFFIVLIMLVSLWIWKFLKCVTKFLNHLKKALCFFGLKNISLKGVWVCVCEGALQHCISKGVHIGLSCTSLKNIFVLPISFNHGFKRCEPFCSYNPQFGRSWARLQSQCLLRKQ